MSIYESFYKDYMTQLAGAVTDEKLQSIDDESVRIADVLSRYSEMSLKYSWGTISKDEYDEYIAEYNIAKYSQKAIELVAVRADYLAAADAEHDGIEFMYDEGINRYLCRPYDVITVFVILLIAHKLFPVENDLKAFPIINAAKYGRRRLTLAKCRYAALVFYPTLLPSEACDIFMMLRNYELPNMAANILSIPNFAECGVSVSIRSYLVLYCVVPLASYTVCLMFPEFLASLLQARIKAISALAVVLYVPYFVAVLSSDVFSFVNFAAITSPGIIVRAIPAAVVLTGACTAVVWKNRRLFE